MLVKKDIPVDSLFTLSPPNFTNSLEDLYLDIRFSPLSPNMLLPELDFDDLLQPIFPSSFDLEPTLTSASFSPPLSSASTTSSSLAVSNGYSPVNVHAGKVGLRLLRYHSRFCRALCAESVL